MPHVVKPQAVEPSRLRYRRPWPFQIGARSAILFAGNDVGVACDALERGKNGEGGGGKVDRFLACLAVLQGQKAAFEVYMFPFCTKDFTKARAGQDQEPDCRSGEWVKLRSARAGLRRMFGVWLV